MKAVRIHEFGTPDVLRYEDAPMPTLKTGEVLVRVHAAGVNPVDWKTREGYGIARMQQVTLPLIVGWDVSGVVEAVAPDVTAFQPGDEVYGMVNFPGIGSAYAEYVAAPAAHLAHKPARLDHVQAAALPLAVLTAWQALFDTVHLSAGQHALIHAAAGGVGHLAVQLAVWAGATVTGTASASNADFVRSLGADIIDYRTVPFESVGRIFDVVMDNVGGEVTERSLQVVKAGGALVSITTPPDAKRAAKLGFAAHRILVYSHGEQLAQIAALVDQGHITPTVSEVFPLRDAALAHQMSATERTRGKIVLHVR